jgi:hypothetical protein
VKFVTSTKKDKMETKQTLTKQEETIHFGAVSFKSMSELEAFGSKIIKSGLTPLKSPEQAVAAILMGKELGLEMMISLNNIVPINGKATLGIHLITALLQKAGVVIELLNDYEPCVPFCMKEDELKDGKPVPVSVGTNKDGKPIPIILRVGYASEQPKDNEIRAKSLVDYRTTVKMTRMLKQPDGSYKESVMIRSFSKNDAINAGLLKDNDEKSAWYKYTNTQCYTRAVAFCGRAIASDVMLGIYETSELADVEGLKYDMVDGKVTILETKINEKSSNITGDVGEVVEPIVTDEKNTTTT